MIDLNNTWCKATEENYKALIPLVYIQNINLSQLGKGSFYIKSDNTAYFSFNTDTPNIKYKQIHLVNGEFKYVEAKPKNNFKEYGFEADFEGEILAVKDDKYFGISKRDELEGWVANGWKKDGTCLYDDVSHLKPIKKEWYENPDNFPCLIVRDYDYLDVAKGVLEDGRINLGCIAISKDKCRPATKEEVLSLLVKE